MKKAEAILTFFLVVVSLKLGKTLLIPLTLAVLLAFLLSLPVKAITRRGVNRIASVVLVHLSPIPPFVCYLRRLERVVVAVHGAGNDRHLGLDLLRADLLQGVGTGVSPVAIILSALFWTWCWGPIGLILAPPFTVCLVALGRYLPPLEAFSVLFGRQTGDEPSFRFFHNLLVNNVQELREMVRELDEQQLGQSEKFDRLMIPALVLAERDLRRGAMNRNTYDGIVACMAALLDELEGEPRTGDGTPEDPQPITDVLVIPMKTQSEFLCGRMIGLALAPYGVAVRVISDQALLGEATQYTKENRIPLVILSAIADDTDTELRYALKRFESWKGEQPAVVAARWAVAPDSGSQITSKLFVVTVSSIREIIERNLQYFSKSGARAEGMPDQPALLHVNGTLDQPSFTKFQAPSPSTVSSRS